MTKQKFLDTLQGKLSGMPNGEIAERIAFYGEVIDDLTSEGLTEEEAVARLGDVDEIARQIITDASLFAIESAGKKRNRRLRVWEIVLLVLGSPVWLSLIVALFSVVVALYAVLWSLIVSVWAIFASLVGGGFGGIVAGVVFACTGNAVTGLAMLGASLLLLGVAIFSFYGSKALTKWLLVLSKAVVVRIIGRKRGGEQ